jgi:TPP-dependent pyruvate/acetoin dehydrogenase alpha subunit
MGVKVASKGKKRGVKAKKQQPKELKSANAVKAEGTPAAEAAPVFENPLVPHAVLRQMYQKIVEMRLLEKHARHLALKSKAVKLAYGHEACRVSLTQGLKAGDVVLDSQPGRLTAYLLGTPLPELLQELRTDTSSRKKKKAPSPTEGSATGLMPFVEDGEVRLLAGLGVAQLLKQLKRLDAVVIYVEYHEASHAVWRQALKLAAKQELPIIFVVLPKTKHGKAKGKAEIRGIALKCGVPGIAVDPGDAIALYRVSQESLGRIRGGGGPVLIEGVPFRFHEDPTLDGADPVAQMKAYLLQRKAGTEDWMAAVEQDFKKQLVAKVR